MKWMDRTGHPDCADSFHAQVPHLGHASIHRGIDGLYRGSLVIASTAYPVQPGTLEAVKLDIETTLRNILASVQEWTK